MECTELDEDKQWQALIVLSYFMQSVCNSQHMPACDGWLNLDFRNKFRFLIVNSF